MEAPDAIGEMGRLLGNASRVLERLADGGTMPDSAQTRRYLREVRAIATRLEELSSLVAPHGIDRCRSLQRH